MKPVDRNSTGWDKGNPAEFESWPLRLVIFGEFKPQYSSDRSSSEEPHFYAIDKESFDDVLSKIAGELPLIIEDSGAALSEDQWLHLPLRNIRSFHPESVVKAVPDLRELLVVCKGATEFAEGKISFEQLQRRIKDLPEGKKILHKLQPADPVPARKKKGGRKRAGAKGKSETAQSDDVVESILGIVDLPGERQKESAVHATKPDIKNLISEVGESRGAGVKRKSGTTRKIVHELNGMLNERVQKILHHAEFRRQEALWRGLKLLIDRTDFREPIRIEVRPCAKENLVEAVTLLVNQVDSGGGLDSDTVILAVYEFDRSSRDMKILRKISEMAEALHVPVASSVGIDFFGIDSARDFERMTGLGAILSQAQYTKWRGLRETESSRWLTLLFNRFLLRYPYGPDQVRVKSFDFSEAPSLLLSKTHLWGNPVWGIGCLITKQFAASGNCLDITGWKNGLIEDLPIREVQLYSGNAAQSPVESHISEDLLAEFTREGIAPFVSRLDTDSAALLVAPTVHLPERYPDEEETRQARIRALLPYQLFVSRIAVCARRLTGAIEPGFAPDALSAAIKEILLEFVPGKKDPESVTVNIEESEQFRDRYDLTLTLKPERAGWRLPQVQMKLLIQK